jgi:hypothetical protein
MEHHEKWSEQIVRASGGYNLSIVISYSKRFEIVTSCKVIGCLAACGLSDNPELSNRAINHHTFDGGC